MNEQRLGQADAGAHQFPAPHRHPAHEALLKVLEAVRAYLPPDGISIHDAMQNICEIVDPWPLDERPPSPKQKWTQDTKTFYDGV